MEWIRLILTFQLLIVFNLVELGLSSLSLNRSCAYQIKNDVVKHDDCRIYHLSGCPADVWTQDEDAQSSEKLRFPIIVNLISYIHRRLGLSQAAINFTFEASDERVSGFAFRLLKGCTDRAPICRFYDLHAVNKSLVLKTVFFNDDVYFPVSHTDSVCEVEVVALSSTRDALGFKKIIFKVPDRDTIGGSSKWKSLIFIDVSSYTDNRVSVSFTSAPRVLNVTSYVVQLYDKTSRLVAHCRLVNGTQNVFAVQFGDIRPGFEYVFEVAPHIDHCDCGSTTCDFSQSPPFLPKDTPAGDEYAVYLLGAFVVILLIAIVLIAVQQQQQKQRPTSWPGKTKIKVYLVYSYDIEKHATVVEALATYLKNHCFCVVLLDKWDMKNKDPHTWVDDCISSADFILMVHSRGAFMKMSRDNTKVIGGEPGYLGEELFSWAMLKIKAAIGYELRKPSARRNLRKFCHVAFPYVQRDMVAQHLPSLPLFRLPRDLNAMLCHFHDVEPVSCCAIPWCREFPKFVESDLSSSSDGVRLTDTIESLTRPEYDRLFGEKLRDYDSAFPWEDHAKLSRLSETETESELWCDESPRESILAGNYGVVDSNFPLNELPLFGDITDDVNRTYWLPIDAIPDYCNSSIMEPFVIKN